MGKLLLVELLKIRRSLSLLMMFALPLMVVALVTMVMVKQNAMAAIGPKQWYMYFWAPVTGMWCYFMLPLYIALVTGLLNGHEHKNQTWRLMLALPVSQVQLFLVKAFLAWLFVLGATAVLAAGGLLVAGGMVLAGASADGAFTFPLLPAFGKVALTCLPVLAIQHAVSWRYQNLVLPLAIGVIATMGITQIGSSKEWVWYPWTYSMMAVHGSEVAKQDHALMLSAIVGMALLGVTAWFLGRREVET
ncbi:MAG: ABC transporter permease [Pseudomonadota bacterium]